jgi:hypothetical protein
MAISGTNLVLWIFCFIALAILSRIFFSLADKYSVERPEHLDLPEEFKGTEGFQKGKLFAGIGWLLIIIGLAPVFVWAAILLSYMWFGGENLINTLSLKTIGLTVVGLFILWKVRTITKDFFART